MAAKTPKGLEVSTRWRLARRGLYLKKFRDRPEWFVCNRATGSYLRLPGEPDYGTTLARISAWLDSTERASETIRAA